MYVVTEITRLKAISNYYAPTGHPFVVSFKFYYGAANEEIADFWTTDLGVTEPLTLRTYVTGVVYANAFNYSNKESLADCLVDSQSYFWDNAEQVLYIHYAQLHHIDYTDPNFDIGIAVGLTDDKIRYFENRPYYPYLISFPQIATFVDKFNYGQMAFIVDTLILDNNTGFFNQFKDVPLYGNKVTIKTGNEGDEYSDLVERANYFVDDYNFSASEFTVDIQDIRKTLTAQVPNKILNVTDYPYLDDTAVGKTIPFAYTPVDEFTHDVPGLLVNGLALDGTTKPDFLFLEVLSYSVASDIEVWIKNSDDVWILQTTGVSVNSSTGIVTVNGAETVSGGTYSAFPVKANVKGVENTYASDIVVDLNERFLGYNFDASGYDLVTWALEEVYLSPISLYMDSTQDVFEWIRQIQSLSTVGFRYTNTADNKRVIKVDNPNRDLSFSVPSIRIKNIEDVVAESNKEDVYNKVYIGYNRSVLNDTAPRVENIDYFDESFAEYKIEKVYNKISGLYTLALATQRALIQADDYYRIHKVFDVVLLGAQYLDINIYDVIELDLSLQTLVVTHRDTYIDTIGATDELIELVTTAQIFQEVLNGVLSELVGDEYFGTVRGQVISTQPDYTLQTNHIRLREKAYSDVFASIYP